MLKHYSAEIPVRLRLLQELTAFTCVISSSNSRGRYLQNNTTRQLHKTNDLNVLLNNSIISIFTFYLTVNMKYGILERYEV